MIYDAKNSMDVFSKDKRSEVMSRIKSKETKCEILLRKTLYNKGIRGYRKNKRIFGFEVDLIFPRKKIAVFCDSDFWHGKKQKMPEENKEYWHQKLLKNKNRDKLANRTLRENGWTVIRLWEKDILKNPYKESDKIIKAIGK